MRPYEMTDRHTQWDFVSMVLTTMLLLLLMMMMMMTLPTFACYEAVFFK